MDGDPPQTSGSRKAVRRETFSVAGVRVCVSVCDANKTGRKTQEKIEGSGRVDSDSKTLVNRQNWD